MPRAISWHIATLATQPMWSLLFCGQLHHKYELFTSYIGQILVEMLRWLALVSAIIWLDHDDGIGRWIYWLNHSFNSYFNKCLIMEFAVTYVQGIGILTLIFCDARMNCDLFLYRVQWLWLMFYSQCKVLGKVSINVQANIWNSWMMLQYNLSRFQWFIISERRLFKESIKCEALTWCYSGINLF